MCLTSGLATMCILVCGYIPTFRRNKLPPASRSIKFMCNKRNCSCYNTALTKAVLVLANCVEWTEKGAEFIRNRFTLTLTDKKWTYFLTEAGLVKPLDLVKPDFSIITALSGKCQLIHNCLHCTVHELSICNCKWKGTLNMGGRDNPFSDIFILRPPYFP